MKKQQKGKASSPYRWALTVFLMAVVLSAVLSLASESMLEGAGVAAALLMLALFIGLGILFDIIGVAVTAADPKPFHAMAAHKEKGAKESLMLLRNAGRVSSVCNDVVGDICVIVTQLQRALNLRTMLISVAVTALVSRLTIGGKALGKTVALKKSTRVVYWAGRFLHLFHG